MNTLLSVLILAHSFYAQDCCGGKDCHPVPCSEIRNVTDGWLWSHQNETILFARRLMRYSEDDDCHVCVSKPDWSGAMPYGICIYLPSRT